MTADKPAVRRLQKDAAGSQAVYRENEGGYFDWHNDYGRARNDPGQEPRKIALSLQLSDGGAYDGCDLEIRAAYPLDVAPRARHAGGLSRHSASPRPLTAPVALSLRACSRMTELGSETCGRQPS